MEVEVKLQLKDAAQIPSVIRAINGRKLFSRTQQDTFVDDIDETLKKSNACLRVRSWTDADGSQQNTFVNDDRDGTLKKNKAFLRARAMAKALDNAHRLVTLKENPKIVDGVKTANETERILYDQPWFSVFSVLTDGVGSIAPTYEFSQIVSKMCAKYNIFSGNLVSLGIIESQRQGWSWNSRTMEIDTTKYAFGTVCEVELEAPESEIGRLRDELETLFHENSIIFARSTRSKFNRMLERTLDP